MEEDDELLKESLHDIASEGSDMTRDIQVALFKERNRPASKSMPQSELLLYEDIGLC